MAKKPPSSNDALGGVLRLFLKKEKKPTLNIPTKSSLLKSYHKLLKQRKIRQNAALEKMLTKRAVRTLSGVAIVTVLTKPFPCPGKCVYCPTEARMPKSYISDEPAAARALGLMFDPYQQVAARIKALKDNGHPTEKVELIVKGGTWNAYSLDYQYWFITRCFEAANASYKQSKQVRQGKLEQLKQKLTKLQKTNESSPHRIIGLTLETRPDFINEKNIKIMRELGCTRIELGVQTTDDKILKLIKRGHDANEVKRATRLLKNFGFKVDYHLMPQLPTATPAKDLKMMLEIFDDPDYRPDMIKIYPCTVIKNSELYQWLKRGAYKTYSDRKLIDVLKKIKTKVPRYVRISRLIRDIPSHHIHAGNKMTNL
ncbi:MAG: tRNA uridine(34) 5-carboxymethylaminomethyl modification radical SAM/GNAT enzyme Elp3, partial [Patescibacteria group bacterium]